MASTPYAAAMGRLKPYFPEFLSKETFRTLLASRDLGELTKLLEGTAVHSDLVAARASYQGIALIEVAINRTLARRLRHAYATAPYAGRGVVGAYLARWDLENIATILSAKARDRPLLETDTELVSSREIPAGLYAGVLTLDDLRGLLAQPNVEAVANALVRYGYGATVLPRLEAFRRSGDIFPILSALDQDYYARLLAQARFFQGDEWVVRELLRLEIDLRNALLLLKGRATPGITSEEIVPRWISGGTLPASSATDLLSAGSVPELADRLKTRFARIAEGDRAFQEDGSVAGYEVALWAEFETRTLERVRMYPLSLAILFHYLLRAELERADLRKIALGVLYGLPRERLAERIVSLRS